jgi:hypothetical protein
MTDNLPSMKMANDGHGLSMQTHNLLPSKDEMDMFMTIAKNAHDSGLYTGVGGQAKLFMVLLSARELGISPLAALNGGIWNIQGKVELSARLMNSMIRRAGHKMKIHSTGVECVITGIRSDTGEQHTEIFNWEMAVKAGLAGGNVWKKYPEDMLYNRCMSRLARRLFPDVIGTAYVEGEIRDTPINARNSFEKAEYEDVTPVQIRQEMRQGPAPIPEIREPDVIDQAILEKAKAEAALLEPVTEEQINNYNEALSKCSTTYRGTLSDFMTTQWLITDPKDMRYKHYRSVMQSISTHLTSLSKSRAQSPVAA